MTRPLSLKQLKELTRLGRSMRLAAEKWDEEWQTLVAIIMSARTRDETTIAVGERLFKKFATVAALAGARSTDVAAVIRQVNFYRNKTKNIIGCAQSLRKRFKGVPPRSVEELITLPGVGRKTANVFLAEMGKDAIGVDTHVSYISRKLGWTKAEKPGDIEKDLEKLFPKSAWRNINRACVHFGKTFTSRREKDALLERVRNIK